MPPLRICIYPKATPKVMPPYPYPVPKVMRDWKIFALFLTCKVIPKKASICYTVVKPITVWQILFLKEDRDVYTVTTEYPAERRRSI